MDGPLFARPTMYLLESVAFKQYLFFSLENGDIIVTLLPVNEEMPWISPAKFRPELVPEELMAPVLTVRSLAHLYARDMYSRIPYILYLDFNDSKSHCNSL